MEDSYIPMQLPKLLPEGARGIEKIRVIFSSYSACDPLYNQETFDYRCWDIKVCSECVLDDMDISKPEDREAFTKWLLGMELITKGEALQLTLDFN